MSNSFGKYELLGCLGAGGMGVVYLAKDMVLGRQVALKVLGKNMGEDEKAIRRFLREARVSAALSHPNIVICFDFGMEQRKFFIAMEYLRGESLRSYIDQSFALSLRQKLHLAIQIAQGLEYAHSSAVIHRDIKPANIQVMPTGEVKILDFGIAKAAELNVTQTDMSVGSPGYASPEQIMNQPVTPATDIFSFGSVLYELLTYRKAFEAQNMMAVLFQTAYMEPAPFVPLEGQPIPDALKSLTMRCLLKKPEERYPNFTSIVEELRRLQLEAAWDKKPQEEIAWLPGKREISPLLATDLPTLDGQSMDSSQSSIPLDVVAGLRATPDSRRALDFARPAMTPVAPTTPTPGSRQALAETSLQAYSTQTPSQSRERSTPPPASVAPYLTDTAELEAPRLPPASTADSRAQTVIGLEPLAPFEKQAEAEAPKSGKGRILAAVLIVALMGVSWLGGTIWRNHPNGWGEGTPSPSPPPPTAIVEQPTAPPTLLALAHPSPTQLLELPTPVPTIEPVPPSPTAVPVLPSPTVAIQRPTPEANNTLPPTVRPTKTKKIEPSPTLPPTKIPPSPTTPPTKVPPTPTPVPPTATAAPPTSTPLPQMPPSPTAPAAKGMDNTEAVKRLIERYQAASEALDVDAMKKIRPGMSSKALKKLQDTYESYASQQVTITVQRVTLAGDTGTVQVVLKRQITPKDGDPISDESTVKIKVRKSGDEWVIDD